MSAESSYAGFPANVPGANTFDWLFSNPFESESEYTPLKQRVPRIAEDAPIFVDHASGTRAPLSYLNRDTHEIGIPMIPKLWYTTKTQYAKVT